MGSLFVKMAEGLEAEFGSYLEDPFFSSSEGFLELVPSMEFSAELQDENVQLETRFS